MGTVTIVLVNGFQYPAYRYPPVQLKGLLLLATVFGLFFLGFFFQ